MKAVLIGYGEVGKGLYEVLNPYHEIIINDPKMGHYVYDGINSIPFWADLLLVAFPYDDNFIEQVKIYQEKFHPKATIIFSSVPIGTCRKLGAIHSPIEGRHDNMAESIRKFPRWIGGYGNINSLVIEKFFLKAGLSIKYVENQEITEFLKLQSTTIYGINIEWARYCKSASDKLGFDYLLLKTYNADYNKLVEENGQPQFHRYNLDPPDGKIGGHCVLPNAKLLHENIDFDHPFINSMLKINVNDAFISTSEIRVIDPSKIVAIVKNLKGEDRSFEIPIPDHVRFIRLVWNYDKEGEPINVGVKEV